jgi:RNA polymerase primary sigma factor
MTENAKAPLWDMDKALGSYLTEIASSTPLSSSDEIELATRIKTGDEEARNNLVEANLRFVVSVAKEYQKRGVPLADLVSAGNMGLITAAERFDKDKGFKFISYAVWWIRQAILQTLSEQSRTVRLP